MVQLTKNADVICLSLADDTYVLMGPDSTRYHALGEIGSRIWEMVGEGNSDDDIVTALTSEYDVDFETCQKEVRDFLSQLSDFGFIVLG
jgi:hypothetical protein